MIFWGGVHFEAKSTFTYYRFWKSQLFRTLRTFYCWRIFPFYFLDGAATECCYGVLIRILQDSLISMIVSLSPYNVRSIFLILPPNHHQVAAWWWQKIAKRQNSRQSGPRTLFPPCCQPFPFTSNLSIGLNRARQFNFSIRNVAGWSWKNDTRTKWEKIVLDRWCCAWWCGFVHFPRISGSSVSVNSCFQFPTLLLEICHWEIPFCFLEAVFQRHGACSFDGESVQINKFGSCDSRIVLMQLGMILGYRFASPICPSHIAVTWNSVCSSEKRGRSTLKGGNPHLKNCQQPRQYHYCFPQLPGKEPKRHVYQLGTRLGTCRHGLHWMPTGMISQN